MEDYKGIYYNHNDDDEQDFYEGGAHFRYKDLYDILLRLEKQYNDQRQKSVLQQKVITFNHLIIHSLKQETTSLNCVNHLLVIQLQMQYIRIKQNKI
jgi:hypothetical protein